MHIETKRGLLDSLMFEATRMYLTMRGLRLASSAEAMRLGLPSFHSGVKVAFLMRGNRTVSK